MQALGVVAGVVDFDIFGLRRVHRCELCRQHDLVAVLALRHPLAQPLLRLPELVEVGCVDEVAAVVKELICQREKRSAFFPLVEVPK